MSSRNARACGLKAAGTDRLWEEARRNARWENDECHYIRHGAAYTATEIM